MAYTVKDLERFVNTLNNDDWARSLYKLDIEKSCGGYSIVAILRDPARVRRYLKTYKGWGAFEFTYDWHCLNYKDLDNGGHTSALDASDRYFKALYYQERKISALKDATSPARLYKLYMAGKI